MAEGPHPGSALPESASVLVTPYRAALGSGESQQGVVDRSLQAAVGLRQFVSPLEAQEEFQVCFSTTIVSY